MYRTITEDLFFVQNISVRKKYTNREMQLHLIFHSLTKLYPENIIVIDPFIFFIVNKSDYFKAKLFIKTLRKRLNKKILIVRNENTLMSLIFELFPDTYVHDITYDNEQTVTVYFISWEERGIAVGCNGDYIKTVNELFKRHIRFSEKIDKFNIRCELVDLQY